MRFHLRRHLPRLAPALFILFSLGLLPRPAAAATLGVPSQYATIQAAVNAAQNGDTVLIADGTYTGLGNVDVDFGGKNITVMSQHGATSTIVNCGGSSAAYHRGFYLHSGETSAVISGLTIQNGYEDTGSATYGGGVDITGASLMLLGCVLKGNVASYGGGVSNLGTGSLKITNCVFAGNTAVEGGGLSTNDASNNVIPANNPGVVTLTNCTFTGNQVYGDGGAVYSYTGSGAPIALVNNIFYGDIIFANSSGGAKTSEVLTYSGATVRSCDVQGGFAGTNNINADPLFYSSADFHLQAGSPCLGAGTSTGAPASTVDGRTRPNPPSIGAYEAVTMAPSATMLTSSVNPANAGQLVVFTATVSGVATVANGAPTGSVTFSIDGTAQSPTSLSSGTAATRTFFTTGGSHTITAVYSGDGSYASSSAPPFTETVNPHVNPQYVSPSGSDSNPGTLAAPKLTIQAAINTALNGDTVIVEDGTYTGLGNVDLDTGGKNLTVMSQTGAATTIIDCGGTTTVDHRGFYLHSGETSAVISGFTIQHGEVGGSFPGSANYPGGAILSYASLTVQNCIIENNFAGVGGGLYSSPRSGNMSVINCVFTGNTAGIGGGMYLRQDGSGTISVVNCTVTSNTASGAGAMPTSGGIAAYAYPYPPGNTGISVTNTIVYGDMGGEIANNGATGTFVNYCDIQGGFAGTGNIDADPLFVLPPFMGTTSYDLHLKPGSLCAGMGTTGPSVPSTAIDGQTRPNPPSIGAYEVTLPSFLINDTDSGITYNGGWFYNSARGLGDLHDDVHATTNNGDSLSYSFIGTGVSLLSETNSDEGMVAVSIDGIVKQTVNCYSAARGVQRNVYSISGLAPGLHSIKLVKISGTVMVVDGLRITTVPNALPMNIINGTDSTLQYIGNGSNGIGNWFSSPGRNLGDVGDDVHAVTSNGSGVIYHFNGTAISYVTETNSDEGNVDVFLDNVLQTTVSCVTATRKTGQTVWSKSGLTPGPHTLLLIKRDGQYMLLDALLVTPTPTVINDTDPGLNYNGGGWFYRYGRGLGDLGDNVHATVYNGDAVSYSFTGTSVSYLTETNPDEGNVAVYIDGVLNQTVSCVTPTRQVQQTVFSVSGLTPGMHTLTLVKTSGMVMVLDGLSFQ